MEVVERWGRFKRIALPGFNCICCCFGEHTAGRLSLQVQHQEVQCEARTKDGVFTDLVVRYLALWEKFGMVGWSSSNANTSWVDQAGCWRRRGEAKLEGTCWDKLMRCAWPSGGRRASPRRGKLGWCWGAHMPTVLPLLPMLLRPAAAAEVQFSVQYRAREEEAYRAFYMLAEPQQQIASYGELGADLFCP